MLPWTGWNTIGSGLRAPPFYDADGRRNPLKFEIPHKVFALIGVLLILSSSACPQAEHARENDIHVEIVGLRNDKGQAVCALFSSAVDFPKNMEKAVARANSVISNRQAGCDFPRVDPGSYAISVIHDENSNGKLDTNLMGIPREGVGASNDGERPFRAAQIQCRRIQLSGRAACLEDHD